MTGAQSGRLLFSPNSETTLNDLEGALRQITEVLRIGNPTHGRTWRGMQSAEHVARALRHVIEWQVGHEPEDIAHALTRMAMAVQLELEARREPEPVGPHGLLGHMGPNRAGTDVTAPETAPNKKGYET